MMDIDDAVTAAHKIGRLGAEHSEVERLKFEAYMKGHCWHFEPFNDVRMCYSDIQTRMLFAVWRDCAALARQLGSAETDAHIEQQEAKPVEKIAPVQGYTPGIPWSLHLEAYDAYSKKWAPQPAMIDLEGRNCRGGFSTGELDQFIPGWRDRVSEIVKLKERIEQQDAAIARLTERAAIQPEGEPVIDLATEKNAFITSYRLWVSESTPDAHPEMVHSMALSHWGRAAGAMWLAARRRAATPAPAPVSSSIGDDAELARIDAELSMGGGLGKTARLIGQRQAIIDARTASQTGAVQADALDAARYSFLRAEAYECVIPHGAKINGRRCAWITKLHPGDSFDAAIDAAMAGSKA